MLDYIYDNSYLQEHPWNTTKKTANCKAIYTFKSKKYTTFKEKKISPLSSDSFRHKFL